MIHYYEATVDGLACEPLTEDVGVNVLLEMARVGLPGPITVETSPEGFCDVIGIPEELESEELAPLFECWMESASLLSACAWEG